MIPGGCASCVNWRKTCEGVYRAPGWDGKDGGCGRCVTPADLQIITGDMVLRDDGTVYRTPCCRSCAHYRPPKVPLPTKRMPDGTSRVDWRRVRMCERNPISMCIHGDAHQVCGLWELSPEWHSPREMEWEYRRRTKGRSTPGVQRQTSLDAYGGTA